MANFNSKLINLAIFSPQWYLGHLKSMNDQVFSSQRTLEETRCKLDSRVLNRCSKKESRQLENDYASVSNMTQCERDKIVEIKKLLVFGSPAATMLA